MRRARGICPQNPGTRNLDPDPYSEYGSRFRRRSYSALIQYGSGRAIFRLTLLCCTLYRCVHRHTPPPCLTNETGQGYLSTKSRYSRPISHTGGFTPANRAGFVRLPAPAEEIPVILPGSELITRIQIGFDH